MQNKEAKEKLDLLDFLKDQGYVKEEDYEDQINDIAKDLSLVDRQYIETRKKHISSENDKLKNQIDYFTMLLKRKENLREIIWRNFAI